MKIEIKNQGNEIIIIYDHKKTSIASYPIADIGEDHGMFKLIIKEKEA